MLPKNLFGQFYVFLTFEFILKFLVHILYLVVYMKVNFTSCRFHENCYIDLKILTISGKPRHISKLICFTYDQSSNFIDFHNYTVYFNLDFKLSQV